MRCALPLVTPGAAKVIWLGKEGQPQLVVFTQIIHHDMLEVQPLSLKAVEICLSVLLKEGPAG